MMNKSIERKDLYHIVVKDNVREIDERHALLLAESIRGSMLISPPTLNKIGDGKDAEYRLVVGFHRYRALQLLCQGYEFVYNGETITYKGDAEKYGVADFIVLSDASTEEISLAQAAENEARRDMSCIQLLRTLQKACSFNKKLKQQDVARIIGISGERVSRVLSLMELPEKVRDHLEKSKNSENKAVQLVRLLKLVGTKDGDGRERTLAAVHLFINGFAERKIVLEKCTVSQIKAAVDEMLREAGVELKAKSEREWPEYCQKALSRLVKAGSKYEQFKPEVKKLKNGDAWSITFVGHSADEMDELIEVFYSGGSEDEDIEDDGESENIADKEIENTNEGENAGDAKDTEDIENDATEVGGREFY